jgi:hypothetical protein
MCLVQRQFSFLVDMFPKNGPEKVTFEVKNLLKIIAGGLSGALLTRLSNLTFRLNSKFT